MWLDDIRWRAVAVWLEARAAEPGCRFALNFDPGPTRIGVAMVSRDPEGNMALVSGAWLDWVHQRDLITAMIDDAVAVGALICVETVAYIYPKAVQQLIATIRAEERLALLIESRMVGKGCFQGGGALGLFAKHWRQSLCRSGTASEKQIVLAVNAVLGAPISCKATARPHVYDAAGGAIVALHGGHRCTTVPLPSAVVGALLGQREQERAAKAVKRAAKKLPPRRSKARGRRRLVA